MGSNAVPPSVRDRLGPEATSGLLDLFEQTRSAWKVEVIELVTDRFERRLVEETSKLRVEMLQGFASLRQEIMALRQEMRSEISHLRQAIVLERFELLKWAFLFWVGQFFAMASLIAVLVRFLRPGG